MKTGLWTMAYWWSHSNLTLSLIWCWFIARNGQGDISAENPKILYWYISSSFPFSLPSRCLRKSAKYSPLSTTLSFICAVKSSSQTLYNSHNHIHWGRLVRSFKESTPRRPLYPNLSIRQFCTTKDFPELVSRYGSGP